MVHSFQTRGLRKAASLLGSEASLRAYLMVTNAQLKLWMCGAEAMPEPQFLRVLKLLSAAEQGLAA